MLTKFKTIEEIKTDNEKLVEVELMLTPEELREFANYCILKDVKFNDWIRELAYKCLVK
jgi:hypothetical protein